MAFLRTEQKFYLHSANAFLLERRLCTLLKRDMHSTKSLSYLVQSLYFDDPSVSSYYEKLDGIEKRSKYRVRFYNNDHSYIRLEKKEKLGSRCRKTSERITLDEANAFACGRFESHNFNGGLKGEFSHLICHERFRPIVFLSYQRKAFIYPAGNVRITLDSDLKASQFPGEFSVLKNGLVPILNDMETILEIKYDSFLPPFISELFEDIPKQSSAISKFCKGVEALY